MRVYKKFRVCHIRGSVKNGMNTVKQLRMKNKLNRSFHNNNIYQ